MKPDEIRFIVFALDSRFPTQNDGRIYPKIEQARLFIQESIQEQYADKFIIASFIYRDIEHEFTELKFVEAVGFGKFARNINQLMLFK